MWIHAFKASGPSVVQTLTLFLPSFRTCIILEGNPQLQLGYLFPDPVAWRYLLEMAKNKNEKFESIKI